MEGLVEVFVQGVRQHADTPRHSVILVEKNGVRRLPVLIGIAEAHAVALQLGGSKLQRPGTHDLMAAIVRGLQVALLRSVITSWSKEVFYARLILEQDGRQIEIDARPSDAIALAVRLEAPIFVAEEVFRQNQQPAA